jgi:hypothetical protein
LYHWCHLIHADLSEYNVLTYNGRCYVIDLGQAVDVSHPRADELLRSDAANVTAFFGRRGAAVLPTDDLVTLVKDGGVAPHPLSADAVRTGSRRGTVPLPGSGLRTTRADTRAELSAGECGALPASELALARGVWREAEVEAEGVASAQEAESLAAAGSEPDPECDVFDGVSGPVAAALKARLRAHRLAARAAPSAH